MTQPKASVRTGTRQGGDAFLEVLRTYGVEHIFSSPGSEWPSVWDGLARLRREGVAHPDYLSSRHEELTLGMATGYGRVSGRLSAVLLHTGVGTLHGAMALRAALHEHVPMVVAAGESNAFGEDAGLDPGSQWLRSLVDLGGPERLVLPYVKWSATVNNPASLPGMLEQACRVAVSHPQGPTFLSVPMEVLHAEVRDDLLARAALEPPRSHPDGALLDRAARALVEARSPLIITELAGRDPGNVARLVALAEGLAAPVVEAQNGNFVNFPRDHPLHQGYAARPLMDQADCVVLLACRGPWHPPSKGPAGGATVIMVDEDPGKAHLPLWPYQVDLCVSGAMDVALEGLFHRVQVLLVERGDGAARAERRERLGAAHRRERDGWQLEARGASAARPIDPRWACQVIGEVLPPDVVIMDETTTHRPFVQRYVVRSLPGTYHAKVTGGLGTGMCMALGIKVAQPERTVACFVGDGAFNYNPVTSVLGYMQEYETPLLTVIFNNEGYAAMKSAHLRYYPEGFGTQTGVFYGHPIAPTPDYSALAPVFGGFGVRVTEPEQLRGAMEQALGEVRRGRFALVDLRLEPADIRGGG